MYFLYFEVLVGLFYDQTTKAAKIFIQYTIAARNLMFLAPVLFHYNDIVHYFYVDMLQFNMTFKQ